MPSDMDHFPDVKKMEPTVEQLTARTLAMSATLAQSALSLMTDCERIAAAVARLEADNARLRAALQELLEAAGPAIGTAAAASYVPETVKRTPMHDKARRLLDAARAARQALEAQP